MSRAKNPDYFMMIIADINKKYITTCNGRYPISNIWVDNLGHIINKRLQQLYKKWSYNGIFVSSYTPRPYKSAN